jgi:hypothetical protein
MLNDLDHRVRDLEEQLAPGKGNDAQNDSFLEAKQRYAKASPVAMLPHEVEARRVASRETVKNGTR